MLPSPESLRHFADGLSGLRSEAGRQPGDGGGASRQSSRVVAGWYAADPRADAYEPAAVIPPAFGARVRRRRARRRTRVRLLLGDGHVVDAGLDQAGAGGVGRLDVDPDGLASASGEAAVWLVADAPACWSAADLGLAEHGSVLDEPDDWSPERAWCSRRPNAARRWVGPDPRHPPRGNLGPLQWAGVERGPVDLVSAVSTVHVLARAAATCPAPRCRHRTLVGHPLRVRVDRDDQERSVRGGSRPHRGRGPATSALAGVDRPVDLALIVLIAALLVSAAWGGVSLTVAGLGGFVYLRGAIVFYAIRALPANDRWASLLARLALGWAAVNSVVALVQVAVGPAAYTALGWRDLEMAGIHRAQGLFAPPQRSRAVPGADPHRARRRVDRTTPQLSTMDAGRAARAGPGRHRVARSVIGVAVGLVVLAALARVPWRRVGVALVALALLAAIPMLAVSGVRDEVARRAAGLGVSLGLPVASAPVDPGLPICGPPPPVHTTAGSACRNVGGDEEIRVVFAREAVPLWFARPVLGYGPGTFGGVVALETDPSWNRHPRLGPAGFDLRGFSGKTVDSFWLHLVIELGTVGLIAYLVWLWLLVRPLLPARADTFVQCGVASVAFVVVIGVFSLSPEGPFVPALLFAALGFAWKRGAADDGPDPGVGPGSPASTNARAVETLR